MKSISIVVSSFLLYAVSLPVPASGQADAQRGAEVLKRERCLECHAVAGHSEAKQSGAYQKSTPAPDLGRQQPLAYTPARLASVMWNHLPQMWPALRAKKIAIPKLSDQDSEDVFAYLYSRMFFNQPGDAGRGAAIFEEKGCSACHSLSTAYTVEKGGKPPAPNQGPGAAVELWNSVSDPVLLVQEMWNHASRMKDAQASMHVAWVQVTGQDLLDVSAYLNSLPVIHAGPGRFSLPEPGSGRVLFEARCAVCHQGTLTLEKRLANQTLTDVAAAMWNHAPAMMNGPLLGPTEMRRVVAYVWERQYMGPAGDVAKGRAVFAEKRCASCHEGPHAVAIARGERVLTPLKIVSVVWVHGAPMLKESENGGATWPTLSPEDVADLVAYLNTQP